MTAVLDTLAYQLTPDEFCRECRYEPAARCFSCSRALTDVGAVNAAIDAVESAPTDEEAATVYRDCLLELAGVQYNSPDSTAVFPSPATGRPAGKRRVPALMRHAQAGAPGIPCHGLCQNEP